MNPRVRHISRLGAVGCGVAGGLMLLAVTGQTTDGFVHANFGSPLGVFGGSPTDSQAGVVAIGDGPSDATELAALLDTAAGGAGGPYRVAVEADSGSGTSELKVFPTAAPEAAAVSDQALALPNKPVVDTQGHVDCSGSVSCLTDPVTNITTVTYPDGIVAMVQKINDTTVVAYKTVTGALQTVAQPLLPESPAPLAAAADQTPADAGAAPAAPAAPDTAAPAEVPLPDISASTVRPRVTISSPPSDYTPGKPGGVTGNPLQIPPNITNPVDVVKGAVGSVVGAIGGMVNDALNPSGHGAGKTVRPSN